MENQKDYGIEGFSRACWLEQVMSISSSPRIIARLATLKRPGFLLVDKLEGLTLRKIDGGKPYELTIYLPHIFKNRVISLGCLSN
jgi:hypothetical protein